MIRQLRCFFHLHPHNKCHVVHRTAFREIVRCGACEREWVKK